MAITKVWKCTGKLQKRNTVCHPLIQFALERIENILSNVEKKKNSFFLIFPHFNPLPLIAAFYTLKRLWKT